MDAAVSAVGTFFTTLVNPASLLGALFYLVFLSAAAVFANRLLRSIVWLSLREDTRNRIDRTAIGFLQQLGSIAIWIVALSVYANLVPSLRSFGTALLAGVSVVSIVIGLAAQNTLGNLVAGLALLIYRPFVVGDELQVTAPTGVETGSVESISLGYTIVRTVDNRRIVLSNSSIANQTTVNLSRADPQVLVEVPLNVANSTDLEQAKSVILELAKARPGVQEVLGCPVTMISASSVTLCLRARCTDAEAAATFRAELLENIKRKFDGAGLELGPSL